MDNQCLIALSKFSVVARKSIGIVNPAKMIRDNEYATQIFQKVDELGDEELLLLSLGLQDMLGQLVPQTKDMLPDQEVKYKFGARG